MSSAPRIGRPRAYASDSEKLSAFRARQESSGYFRKEVLMTAETILKVQDLARKHGVTVTDVASALLEEGIASFERSGSEPGVGRAAENEAQRASPASKKTDPTPGSYRLSRKSASPAPSLQPEASASNVSSNPILNFFARRKESHK